MTTSRPIDSFFNITYKDVNNKLVCHVDYDTTIHRGLPDVLLHTFRRHGKLYLLDSPNTKAVLYDMETLRNAEDLESLCLTSIPTEYLMAIPTKKPFVRRLIKCEPDAMRFTHVVYCSLDRSSSVKTWVPIHVSMTRYE
jgi:hypothetical protein